MTKRSVLIALFLAVLGGLFAWFFLANFKQVTHVRDLPMTGEARYNPLYALQLSLRELGQKVETHPRLSLGDIHLKADDTLLLYSPPSGLSEAQIDSLITWVESGGHLIVKSPNGGFLDDDLMLYTKLGVTAADIEEECFQFRPVGEKKRAELCGERFLVDDTEWYTWLLGDEEHGYSLGRMDWGDGTVTIASSLEFMSNTQLKENGARQLTYQLLANTAGKGSFHLVYATDMSPLWLLLLKHSWSLLLPLAVLLAAWLVYRSQRFGPLQASPNQDRRALLEHISATGEYMFHRHLGHELHLAVVAMFNSKLRRRDPMMAALSGEAQIQALAERTKIDPEKIRQAFKPGSLRQKENFFHSIVTLIQLRNQL